MFYTGAIKNMLGVVPGENKSKYHKVASATGSMADMLVDIFGYVKPQLAIMDAIVGMEGNGPLHGHPRKIGAIIASIDSVAVDAVGSAVINYSPLEISTTKIAAERGLGEGNIHKIDVVGVEINKVKVRGFKKPDRKGY